MMTARFARAALVTLASLICLPPLFGQPNSPDYSRTPGDGSPFHTRTATSMAAQQAVPIESLPPMLRERVRKVMTQPTLATHAPAEEFYAVPQMYEWLLDHPDRATLAWQRLGVQCTPIADKGQGRFSWADENGSEVVWFTIVQNADVRVWYAEGRVKPGALLPTIPIRAVVILRHNYPGNAESRGRIHHQVDIFASTDSRAANLVARLLGPTADHMAEQGAGQMLTFFGVLAQYIGQHPDQQDRLLAPKRNP
ncbi:MAG TPA: hypothetical protein VKS79_00690 [Gemmataceae bacterium]|nr:hypothetical protein [Gemmataceae bacterium]